METNEDQPGQESQPEVTPAETAPVETPTEPETIPEEAPVAEPEEVTQDIAPEPTPEQIVVADPEPEVAPVDENVIAVPEEAVVNEETGLTPNEVEQRLEIGKTIGVGINTEREELYTIEAADLNRFPELSSQGVRYGDQVAYGSLWVLKSATAGGVADTRTPFPQSTSSKKFPSWQNL